MRTEKYCVVVFAGLAANPTSGLDTDWISLSIGSFPPVRYSTVQYGMQLFPFRLSEVLNGTKMILINDSDFVSRLITQFDCFFNYW